MLIRNGAIHSKGKFSLDFMQHLNFFRVEDTKAVD